MNTLNIIALILGTLIVLVILVYFFMRKNSESIETKSNTETIKEDFQEVLPEFVPDFEALKQIIRDKKSSPAQLEKALDLIIKYYGNIHPKIASISHPEFDNYGELIIRLCHHPRVNSKIILKFDKELRAKNPEYERDINSAITKGLELRV